jgi:hypothetical protein
MAKQVVEPDIPQCARPDSATRGWAQEPIGVVFIGDMAFYRNRLLVCYQIRESNRKAKKKREN